MKWIKTWESLILPQPGSYSKLSIDEWNDLYQTYTKIKFTNDEMNELNSILKYPLILSDEFEMSSAKKRHKDLTIWIAKFTDDYFLVVTDDTISIVAFLCDEWEGLKQCLKDNGFLKNEESYLTEQLEQNQKWHMITDSEFYDFKHHNRVGFFNQDQLKELIGIISEFKIKDRSLEVYHSTDDDQMLWLDLELFEREIKNLINIQEIFFYSTYKTNHNEKLSWKCQKIQIFKFDDDWFIVALIEETGHQDRQKTYDVYRYLCDEFDSAIERLEWIKKNKFVK